MESAMSKHTPGPWTYFVGNANGRGLVRVETARDAPHAGLFVCSMHRGAEAEANARLIAAAPDMLDTERRLAAEVGGLRAFEHEVRAGSPKRTPPSPRPPSDPFTAGERHERLRLPL